MIESRTAPLPDHYVVLTEMGQRVWGEEAKAAPMLARIPLGRFVVPQ
jgi:hypothetical protein